jgi:CRISPR-associated endonuclease/helicase Cas3
MKAHSHSKHHGPHPWLTHSEAVSRLANEFGTPLGLGHQAEVAGWCHDLGKLGARFQRRLDGEESGIDHSSAGALFSLKTFKNVPIALAIQGHHIGLQSGAKAALRELSDWQHLQGRDDIRLSSDTLEELLGTDDWQSVPPLDAPRRFERDGKAKEMLHTRMLFSCLVDADYLDTEAHFQGTPTEPKLYRPSGPTLDPEKCLAALDAHMERLPSKGVDAINELRQWVRDDCVRASELPTGIYTLTAPTGTGKTLAMLRFGLLHAKKHALRRLILVLPYLNLIDEAAAIYRNIFREFPEDYVLEDHSLARADRESDQRQRTPAELWAENWDAPIIITTNIQFLESLHAHRPARCRKLHRIAKSVVLMDEVQTIPDHLAPLTLATLSNLATGFGATVVFATATQPAFDLMDEPVKELVSPGWKPEEIVHNTGSLFAKSQRVSVQIEPEVRTWEAFAEELSKVPGSLVVLNVKAHAAKLLKAMQNRVPNELLAHLSTNMLTEHRRQALRNLKEAGLEEHGWLIATQCVEAGVDLDFRRGFRAWGPMEALVQAAGRVNRNGRQNRGEFTVFTPPDEVFPPGGYKQATDTARNILIEMPRVPLHDPELFRRYYARLYKNRGEDDKKVSLGRNVSSQNYVEVSKHYRLIENSGVNIFIRLIGQLGSELQAQNDELYAKIADGVDLATLRRLRKHSVSVFLKSNVKPLISPLKTLGGIEEVPDWYVLRHPEDYDEVIGLMTEGNDAEYIV